MDSVQYIGGTYQLHKLCGGSLNWTTYNIGNLQPGRRWKLVCDFAYRMLLSLLQIPIYIIIRKT